MVEYVEKVTPVPLESSQAIEAICDVIKVVIREGKDGYGVSDMPEIVSSAVVAANELADFDKILEEYKANKLAFYQGVIVSVMSAFGDLLDGK